MEIIIWRHFEDISEKEVGLKLSQKELKERLKKSYWLFDTRDLIGSDFERGLVRSQILNFPAEEMMLQKYLSNIFSQKWSWIV